MSISSISQSNYQAFTPITSSAKSATQADPATESSVKAADPAKADTTAKETAPDEDAKTASSGKGGTSAAPNMYKLNPDGTVGPLHLPRPGHAPGVVHA